MADKARELEGVGGWLTFFILTLTVFGPLRSIIATASNLYGDAAPATFYGTGWALVQMIEWSLALLANGMSIYLGWRMYKVHVWRSVQLTIAGIWLITPLTLAIDLVAISLLSGLSIATLASDIGRGVLRASIYAGIWTGYLLCSRRVANTYARHPEADELATVFD